MAVTATVAVFVILDSHVDVYRGMHTHTSIHLYTHARGQSTTMKVRRTVLDSKVVTPNNLVPQASEHEHSNVVLGAKIRMRCDTAL